MTTMGALVDRTLRDWLEPADDQPSRLVLVGALTAVSSIILYDPELIGPEELELLAGGTLLEIDSEEVIVGDVDETNNRLTGCIRGVNGTLATSHAAGAFVYPRRLWRRRVLFDALADQIVSLYPDLYQVRTTGLVALSTTTFTEVPVGDAEVMVAPMWVRAQPGGSGRWRTVPISDGDYLDDFPAAKSGKAFYVRCGGNLATSGYLTYRARFARPTLEADDLEDDLGVQREWEQIVMVGAVAYLTAGRELDLVTQNRLSDQLEQKNYPPDSPSKVRDNLLRYQTFLMNQAKQDLQARWPVTVSMSGAWG